MNNLKDNLKETSQLLLAGEEIELRDKNCLILEEINELFVSQNELLIDEFEREVHSLSWIWAIIYRKHNNEN